METMFTVFAWVGIAVGSIIAITIGLLLVASWIVGIKNLFVKGGSYGN